MLHSVNSAAIAPTAASAGARTAPTTPIVRGNSTMFLPSLLRIVMRRIFLLQLVILLFTNPHR